MWIVVIIGLIVIVLGTLWGVRNQVADLHMNMNSAKPTLWWVVDDSQVNAREWLDWGNRATREPNEPFLRLCLGRARTLWGSGFDIVPLIGRRAVLERLQDTGFPVPEGADRCPPPLWMAWCQAAMLHRFGGLWVDGSVLPVAAASPTALKRRIADHSAAMLGRSGSAGWSLLPNHPAWRDLEAGLTDLILRGDQSWGAETIRETVTEVWARGGSGVIHMDPDADIATDTFGRPLTLETLLGETEWPHANTKDGLWVPFPGGRDGMERASVWQWFTRMSIEQILEAPFVWAQFARGSLVGGSHHSSASAGTGSGSGNE